MEHSRYDLHYISLGIFINRRLSGTLSVRCYTPTLHVLVCATRTFSCVKDDFSRLPHHRCRSTTVAAQ